MTEELLFLKLGGSLITDKDQPHTARLDVLDRLAREIVDARSEATGGGILLGHGSGSFGHTPAARYQTRLGVRSAEQWQGFLEVWREAAALHRLVIDALQGARLPVFSFPPSASVIAADGEIVSWDLAPIRSALHAGLIPVVYGDVVFDTRRGGTILSTEDLFVRLAEVLRPSRVLIAGEAPGVWADYPACTRLLEEIKAEDLSMIGSALQGAKVADVTGGMASKVRQCMRIASMLPAAEVRIFSGVEPGTLVRALRGEPVGTRVRG